VKYQSNKNVGFIHLYSYNNIQRSLIQIKMQGLSFVIFDDKLHMNDKRMWWLQLHKRVHTTHAKKKHQLLFSIFDFIFDSKKGRRNILKRKWFSFTQENITTISFHSIWVSFKLLTFKLNVFMHKFWHLFYVIFFIFFKFPISIFTAYFDLFLDILQKSSENRMSWYMLSVC